MNIYAIYDRVSGTYFSLALHRKDDLYKRSLHALANDSNPDNMFSTHSHDFDLYCIGQLNEHSGEITPENRYICCAADLKSGE